MAKNTEKQSLVGGKADAMTMFSSIPSFKVPVHNEPTKQTEDTSKEETVTVTEKQEKPQHVDFDDLNLKAKKRGHAYTYYLQDENAEKIKERAQAIGVSASTYLNAFLDQYLDSPLTSK